MGCARPGCPRSEHLSNTQVVEQRLCLFQIERVEAIGEPAVDRSEKFSGLIALPLMSLDKCFVSRVIATRAVFAEVLLRYLVKPSNGVM